MHETNGIESRLRQATTLPGVLAASFDASEVVRLLAYGNEDRYQGCSQRPMTAADAAVDGRETVTAAVMLFP